MGLEDLFGVIELLGLLPDPPFLKVACCRGCGAKRQAFVTVCWLCGAPADAPDGIDERDRPLGSRVEQPVGIAERRSIATIGLSTLMVLVVLCAVLYAVFLEWPGLGGLLAIVLTPVMVLTIKDVVKREVWGRPMTVWEKLGTFAAATGLVVVSIAVLVVVTFVAFYACCFVILGRPW